MSRDTLLIVSTSYPQQADGSEAAGAFVADLATALSRLRPVRVVAPGSVAGRMERDGDVQVWRFASPGRPLSLLSPSRPADWPATLSVLASLRAQTRAAAADGRVCHALACWALPSGWAARGLPGVPYSIWALGSDIWSLGRLPVVRSLLRRVARDARFRFADGMQLGRDAERLTGQAFDFLPSTRRTDRASILPLRTNPPYRLLFLGRWHPNKGVDLLLEALERLSEEDWQRIALVHVAGGGPLQELVHARVAALQAAGRPVRLDGFLDAAAARAALDACDWVLIPSRIESIPVVFSDAVKAGRPVISMPVGDLPELVRAQPACGVLAAEVSAAAFAAAIAIAVSSTPGEQGAGVARAAALFDLDAVALRLHEAIGVQGSSPEFGGR